MSLKVFVGVSVGDRQLIEEYSLAEKTISELKLEPIIGELIPSFTQNDVEEISLDGVRLCDLYVGILGAESSPEHLRELQEAIKHSKKCYIFVKKMPERQAEVNKFLEHAKNCECAEFSALQEFSSQLQEALQAFIATETLSRLKARNKPGMDFVRAYVEGYVRPVLDEVKEIENSLTDRRLVELPTHAWNVASDSTFLGAHSDLDRRIAEFYSKVRGLNDLRQAAVEEHKQDVTSIMQEAFFESALALSGCIAIERLLVDNFGFFLTVHDAYSEIARPMLDQLEGQVRSVAPEHRRVPYVSAVWLVNKISQRKMIASLPVVVEGPIPRHVGGQYLNAFLALHSDAARVREVLRRICQLSEPEKSS